MANKIKAKRILQLHAGGMSRTSIAKIKGFSEHGVADTLDAAGEMGIAYQDVADMSDEAVYRLLFPERNRHEPAYALPDWERVHKELAKTGVTLKLLHAEYVDECAEARAPHMGYDRFCKLYRAFAVKSNVTSRVGHKSGRIVEVDWSGPTMELADPGTGELTTVYLFVGTLPFSRYSYVEPTLDMKQDTLYSVTSKSTKTAA